MASLWPPRSRQETSETGGDLADVADTGAMGSSSNSFEYRQQPPAPDPPARPMLQRNSMQNSSAPPVPEPPQNTNSTDSLSLLQLRRIVAEANRSEPVAYDFVYSDLGPHAEEIDEWFVYQFWQWVRLNAAQKAFEWYWDQELEGRQTGWDDADHGTRARFIRAAIAGVQSNDAALRAASIGKLSYLVLGRWGDTAMSNASSGDHRTVASISQLQAIKAGVECLASLEGLPVVWQALQDCFESQWVNDISQSGSQEAQDELLNLMTIMYIVIQETLNDPDDMSSTYGKLLDLNPSLVDFMLTATTKLRWDEPNIMPQTQIFLLLWKSILLVFGGMNELEQVKRATQEKVPGKEDRELITASPLDYHVFRQEITSKYPAYIPPQPVIPFEAENNSILPLSNHPSRNAPSNGINLASSENQKGGGSILNQPVHIATPAPSPPPSPAVGGKGGKKQNYQTNQNFPFMYPPLDASSNSAGGKGLAGVHEAIVDRKWEGSDIPASILEAGELFSARVRMTRATRQLWEERERFLRFERGWDADDSDDDIPDLDLDALTLEDKELLKGLKAHDRKEPPVRQTQCEVDLGPHPEAVSARDKQRLLAVEKFYRHALPHLQSLVIVLLRPILANVTAIVSQQPPQGQPATMGRGQVPAMTPGINGPIAGNGGGGRTQDPAGGSPPPLVYDPSPEEIDATRTREITAKAMTGILVLLLKWLRLSHVLKFEYMTQLLLDSNYIPLVLKLFAHQDIQQVVDSKMDRAENSFFQFCNLRFKSKDKVSSDNENEEDEEDAEAEPLVEDTLESEDEDEAAPPPIRRSRTSERLESGQEINGRAVEDGTEEQNPSRPEVDELGYPLNAVPTEPITDFSKRNFFSLINYLRVMQKVCKNKAHRNLLLVQYKSSTILRKSLRIPQPELRLYTLKLFKNQVPYCGRKWRQSNMRVITAVYLHCRPELRDEWLAGSDIDAEVDAALPLEQALRSLTHWLNTRDYPDKIALETQAILKEEQTFFTRELEKLDMTLTDFVDDGMSEVDQIEGWA